MSRYYYDLHTHSCLSPCADDDNTPNNLLGMASLAGIDILALTDHNTAKNCPAFFEAAYRYGVIPIAGVELTTAEDIHVICLFEQLDDAMRFDDYLLTHRNPIKNKPHIFGNQIITDKDDNATGSIDTVLSFATDITVDDVKSTVDSFNGISYPAHIDREANGIITTLGTLPEYLNFSVVEFRDKGNVKSYCERFHLTGKKILINSDAHNLTDIRDKDNFLDLDANRDDADSVRKKLFKYLRS